MFSPLCDHYGMRLLTLLAAAAGFFARVAAYDITKNSNLAVYWGQDSAGNQGQLSDYCEDSTIDNIVLAFLYVFFGPAPTLSQPEIDFANICNQYDFDTFPGTDLADCSFMASQIQACQAKGKIITLSLGGATGQVGFSTASAATSLANRIWNEFLGGSSSTRPFGSAVLDGLDLDIESGSSAYYNTFVNTIRSLSAGSSKRYYITAAPQCPFPDEWIGNALNTADFDAVYVQFYNNYCGLDAPSDYNFATWDSWARSTSFNKNIKVYIGAPASANAAGTGYVSASKLASYATAAQDTYASFGGVMLWDASEAVANNNYHVAIKKAMVANAGPLQPATLASASAHHAATAHVGEAAHVTAKASAAAAEKTPESEVAPAPAAKAKDTPTILPAKNAVTRSEDNEEAANATEDTPAAPAPAPRVNSRIFRL